MKNKNCADCALKHKCTLYKINLNSIYPISFIPTKKEQKYLENNIKNAKDCNNYLYDIYPKLFRFYKPIKIQKTTHIHYVKL